MLVLGNHPSSVLAPLVIAALSACASVGQARVAAGPGERDLTFSIQGILCSDCGKELEETASKQPGVRGAKFDEKTIELHLIAAADADEAQIAKALEAQPIDGERIHALLGAGRGSYAPFDALDPSWDAKIVSANGDDFGEIKETASPGKITVVDFYADWCGPCHDVDRYMHALLAKDGSIAYRRINIVSWDTPVAKHHLKRVEALPFVVVLGPRGEEVARISGLDLAAIDAAIQKGRAR
jgi:thiol-disulfide isomerase/thioredoxin